MARGCSERLCGGPATLPLQGSAVDTGEGPQGANAARPRRARRSATPESLPCALPPPTSEGGRDPHSWPSPGPRSACRGRLRNYKLRPKPKPTYEMKLRHNGADTVFWAGVSFVPGTNYTHFCPPQVGISELYPTKETPHNLIRFVSPRIGFARENQYIQCHTPMWNDIRCVRWTRARACVCFCMHSFLACICLCVSPDSL